MVERFEVYLVDLDPQPTGEAKNTRPAVVISPDEMNRHTDHVLIAPLASTRAKYPTRISTAFLNAERFVILDQIRAVEKRRLVKKIGELDKDSADAVLALLAEMFAA